MMDLQFRLTDRVQEEALGVLFPEDPGRSMWQAERGFLGLIGAGVGRRRRVLMLRSIVAQEDGWVSEGANGLRFAPAYFSRAITLANRGPTGSGLILVHSHPGGDPQGVNAPRPSAPDLHHERKLLWVTQAALRPGAPVAAGIVGANGRWRVREYGWKRPKTARQAISRRFGPEAATLCDASSTSVVGPTRTVQFRPSSVPGAYASSSDSTMGLWGTLGQSILRDVHLGVAGAGGVGSMIIEQAARLGVGRITLVDYDVLKEENLNRAEGASIRDLNRPKIRYLVREARKAAICETFEIEANRASVSEWEGLRPLLDCDVILNAADNPFARQVLDYAAYAYEIPVVDGGTVFLVDESGKITGKSQVSEAGPGRPCLECQGVYTKADATLARESPVQQGPFRYVVPPSDQKGIEPPRAPSVISHNGVVASLMIQRLLRIVLGFPPDGARFQQRFYVESGEIRWGPVTACIASCTKPSVSGLGIGFPVPVGTDPFWDATRQSVDMRQSAASTS